MIEYSAESGAALIDSEYADLALDCIVASPTNPRKRFNAAKMAELAASIKADEVHEPIVVRPLPASRLQDTFAAGNSYLGLLHQASHSHADRAALANVLRDRGHAVKSDFCKIYRRKP